MLDFSRSFMTFFTRDGGNIARIQLDAACRLIEADGRSEQFYLIAPCRAERMYRDEPLFQLPNYEFCGIWSAREFQIIRTHWQSERDNRQVAAHGDRFAECRLDLVNWATAEALADRPAILAATLANRPLVAHTELRNDARGRRAVLEYPIKTMNVRREPVAFQVDTGPLIVPDLAAWSMATPAPVDGPPARPIESFDLAYVVYHHFDQAEFILRRPNPVGAAGSTTLVTDYATVQRVAARHMILAVG